MSEQNENRLILTIEKRGEYTEEDIPNMLIELEKLLKEFLK